MNDNKEKIEYIKTELDALIESVPFGIAVLKIEGDNIVTVKENEGFSRFIQLDLSAPEKLLSDADHSLLRENAINCAKKRQSFSQDVRIVGVEKWFRLSGQYHGCDSEGNDLIYCTVLDITANMLANKMLRKEDICIRMIAENTGVFLFDYDVELDTVNTRLDTLSFNAESINSFIKEMAVKEYIHPDDLTSYYSAWNKALMAECKGAIDYRTRLYDGEYRWYRMNYVSVEGADGRISNVYGMAYSIDHMSPIKNYFARDQKEFEQFAISDHVTGLYTRVAFRKAAAEILKEQFTDTHCFAIVYSDINEFSYINESLGYEAGDEMLRDFANIICGGAICLAGCRIYSDFFIALCRGSDRDAIIKEVEKRNNEFVTMQKAKYPHSNLSVSSGVYFLRSADEDITIAMDNANLARRSVKGINDIPCGVYAERMRKKRSHDQTIASEVWNAIATGEIELFLQPKFDLVTREMIGAEALTRWRNPDGSYKLPYEFIDVLEDVGYIVHLDMYIYEQVLKCLARWKQEGKKLVPISVNFSRKHNSNAEFVTRVTELAEIYGVDKSLLELEITESCFTQDVKNLFSNMRKLREQGFRIDIDDFGTGYSSLSVLIDAPVDIVKVDKVFIDDISNSELSRDYVQHICSLIKSTRKDIIFEGVETEEQARILAEGGHTMAQGWLFDKAISIDEFDQKYLCLKKTV